MKPFHAVSLPALWSVAALLAVSLAVTAMGAGDAAAVSRGDSVVTRPAPAAAYDSLRVSRPRIEPAYEVSTPSHGLPILLDRDDMGFGTTVVFSRIPNTADLRDLGYAGSVMHVVLTLPAWPASWNRLQALQQVPLPDGADLIVVLPGYPPTREAAEAWNYLRLPLRIVAVVPGPPVDRGSIADLNALRGLERVIVDMPQPSRAGFERLQRPLSFRVVRP